VKLQSEDGQSLVELALTIPLLLLMLMGMAELGQICYGAINVSNAAKAAAQYAAQDSNTASDTAGMLAAAQNEIGTLPGLVGSLDMPAATTMPDGSALPAGTACTLPSGGSYSCSYCSCSSPDSAQTPFACGATNALSQCTGISQLEQNIIVQTHIQVNPLVSLPGMSTFNLYGHAVVKRLQ